MNDTKIDLVRAVAPSRNASRVAPCTDLPLASIIDLICAELGEINAQLEALLADLRREAQEERKDDDRDYGIDPELAMLELHRTAELVRLRNEVIELRKDRDRLRWSLDLAQHSVEHLRSVVLTYCGETIKRRELGDDWKKYQLRAEFWSNWRDQLGDFNDLRREAQEAKQTKEDDK